MKRFPSSSLILAVAFFLLGTAAVACELDDALLRWEGFGRNVDYQELLSCADSVRKSTPEGDAGVVERLIQIVQSDKQGLPSRTQALLVACELTDDAGAQKLLETAEASFERLRQAWENREDFDDVDGAPFVDSTLLGAFIDGGAQHLCEVRTDQKTLLAFLRSFYVHGRVGRRTRLNCARLISKCKAPLVARQDAVLEIIEKRPAGGVHEVLFDVLDAGVFPRLRHMVRTADTPDGFNFSAASALSYLGDREIVPDLEARRGAFRAAHRNLETVLRKYLWRIEVQHPPTKLLKYISSTALREQHHEMRMWAVRRAHELGVDRGQIREAILQHVRNASTPLERAEVTYLKGIGTELGILQDSDLPDVTIGDSGVMP